MTGTHRDTICRLLVEVGDGCAKLMDEQMRELPCRRIEVDEIWAYVGKKQRHLTRDDDPRRVGDQYTFVALDPETKIVPAYRVGKRDLPTATAFITDLSERLANRVQLHRMRSRPMSRRPSGPSAQMSITAKRLNLTKQSQSGAAGTARRTSSAAERIVIAGNPDPALISTSLIERQNLTMRMSMRRFTRLTNAFSKKIENLRAAVSLHFAHYNFVRVHRSLRVTPAMEAGSVEALDFRRISRENLRLAVCRLL